MRQTGRKTRTTSPGKKIPTQKPEGATSPPDTPVKAVDAVSTTRSPEAIKTADTTGSQEKTITREKTKNITKDAWRP